MNIAINLILRIVGGVVIALAGVYMIMNGHPNGGWVIFGGLLFGSVSVSTDKE